MTLNDNMNTTTIGAPERATQNRIVGLFRDVLGYDYLGDKTDEEFDEQIEKLFRGVTRILCGRRAAAIW